MARDTKMQSIWKGVEKIMASQKRIQDDIKFRRVHLKHLESKNNDAHHKMGTKIITNLLPNKAQTPEEINSNMDQSEQYYVNDEKRSNQSSDSYSSKNISNSKPSKTSKSSKSSKSSKFSKYERREFNRKQYEDYKVYADTRQINTNFDSNNDREREYINRDMYRTRDRGDNYDIRRERRIDRMEYMENKDDKVYIKNDETDRDRTKRFIDKNIKKEYVTEYYKPRQQEEIRYERERIYNEGDRFENKGLVVKQKKLNNVNELFKKVVEKKRKRENEIIERVPEYEANPRLKADEESRYNEQYY